MSNKILISIIIILSLIILITGGYIIQKEVRTNLEQSKVDYFNNGTIYGAQAVIYQILEQGKDCSVIQLPIGNQTFGVIRSECFQGSQEVAA